jgi:hypothetical protein
MKRLEQLIATARELSQNTSYDTNSGIPQRVFVQYFNNAQDSLMKNVVNLKTKYFKTNMIVPVIPNQAKYDYPYNLFMHNIDTIQWYDSASGTFFRNLTQSYTKEKITSSTGFAFGYINQDDGIHLNPPINTGFLDITYEKTVPKLQKKNGKISSVTISGSNQLTALSVDISGPTYDAPEIDDDFFLCVVDKYGAQKARSIEYISQTAGVFTLPAQPLITGQSISVGDYITIGKNTVNLPQWPDICESFLIDFVVYSAKYGDSSQWAKEAKEYLSECFSSLAGSFASPSDDIIEIPITNSDYIGS